MPLPLCYINRATKLDQVVGRAGNSLPVVLQVKSNDHQDSPNHPLGFESRSCWFIAVLYLQHTLVFNTYTTQGEHH